MKKPSTKKPTKRSAQVKKSKFSQVASFSSTTPNDFIVATLIISLLVNLFMVCLWIALQYTTQYDSYLSNFFFGR